VYLPPHFTETDPSVLHALIRAHPLGLLISSSDSELVANPVPFLLETTAERAVLRAHVARANPQWKHIRDGARVLVVFQGEEAYISPSWYASKPLHGKVVPTWNYAIVQASGVAVVHEEPFWLMTQISALTETQEGSRPSPWAITDAPAAFIEAQMRGIVGIEIDVTEMTGKWKVSQNRDSADRSGVGNGLALEGKSTMAALVAGERFR
jgi:transcriptional regulator